MANKVYLTSFYGSALLGDPHWPDRQQRLHQTALAKGEVDAVIQWDGKKLDATGFIRKNAEVFKTERGYGYWLWKPFVILEALKNIDIDDYVVYHDVGRPQRNDVTRGYTLDRDISPLIRWAENNNGMYPGVYMPHHGKQKHWTKRDCFVLMDCDSDRFWESPQVQATYNIWKNTAAVRHFIAEWLSWCLDPRILTDSDNTSGKQNFPGFKEHRYDQSILTNLCVKHDIKVYGSPSQSTLLHRNLNSLIRHARFDELVARKENKLRSLVAHSPEKFDRSTIRWIELYYAERRTTALSILLIGRHSRSIWDAYAPNATIQYFTDAHWCAENLTGRNDQLGDSYDLIVVSADEFPADQFKLVTRLFPRVSVSGLLICGQIRTQWDSLPGDHQSALALMRDGWKNKQFTHVALTDLEREQLNSKLLITFAGWDRTGETGNAYFVRYDS